jgi:hypothetical protein
MIPKPLKGTALKAKRERRAALVKHEQTEMRAALVRDGMRCRNPRCGHRKDKYPIDPAHVIRHRGIGGDPSGTRTARNLIAALCRICHGQFDGGLLAIEPLDADRLTDGPLAWYRKHLETGVMEHYATEAL